MTLEEILREIWRQALVEGASIVEIEGRTYRVCPTPKRRLKEVDFTYEGRNLRGIEQNPDTASRWAEMARKGAKIMQFTEVPEGPATARGRFFANVADGKATWYCSADFPKKGAGPSGARKQSRG